MASVRAFVPGHVTGFFTVESNDDPVRAGSTGAGIALTDGVTVTVSYDEDQPTTINGRSLDVEPVDRVRNALAVPAEVRATTELSLGAGFGVSGAMALGTAFAANQLFDLGLSENELVSVAHGAEVQAGTGLGDVVSQARGGVPIRLDPGAPHYGMLDGIPQRTTVEYVTFGQIETSEVLSEDPNRLSDAGEEALSRIVQDPTLETFMYASRRFARETGLLTESVGQVITDVAEVDGTATMAMLGETVFAFGDGLSAAGYEPERCGIDLAGARMLQRSD